MHRWLSFSIFLICSGLNAIEYSPWLGNVLEPNLRASAWLNSYQSVDTGHGVKRQAACDGFFDLDVSLAYRENIEFELEAVAAKTRTHCFGMDSVLFAGKYRFWNDIVGDPLTVTAGAVVSKVFKHALQDIAAFHHGGIQGEVYLSAGREFSCMQFWMSRVWGVVGFGIADLGSPWIRGDIAWEHNCWDRHQFKLFVDTLWGLGHNNLHLHHFKGYGPVNHQSVDAGIRYSLGFDYGIFLRFEYAYRVYARNCPRHVNRALLSLFYPLGL